VYSGRNLLSFLSNILPPSAGEMEAVLSSETSVGLRDITSQVMVTSNLLHYRVQEYTTRPYPECDEAVYTRFKNHFNIILPYIRGISR
jgi:hypothetical protein